MPPKNLLLSKTIWGAILLSVAQFAPMDEALQTELVNQITALLGLVLTVWGRATARRPLTVGRGAPLVLLLLLAPAITLTVTGCTPAHRAMYEQVDSIEDGIVAATQEARSALDTVTAAYHNGIITFRTKESMLDEVQRVKDSLQLAREALAAGRQVEAGDALGRARVITETLLRLLARVPED